ncbi:sensor histidine kinase [Spirillospora sp. CA-253888]
MAADDRFDNAAGARLGGLFRLLMQVRILVATVSLLLVPAERRTLNSAFLVVCIVALSVLGVIAWRQIASWLLKYPVLLGIDACISYAVLEAGGVLGPFFLFTLITSAVSGLLYRRLGIVLICVVQVMLYYAAAAGDAELLVSFQTLIAMPAFYLIVAFIGHGLRGLLDEHGALEEARRKAEVLAAGAEERARLAREMHDSLTKTLRGIALVAMALPTWVERSPDRAAAEARRISAAAEAAAAEARQLITDLRTAPAARPLADQVRDVARDWSAEQEMPTSATVLDFAEPPPVVAAEIVAVLKEALENVARHAHASRVEVGLAEEDDRLVLTVRDDGRGMAGPPDLERLFDDGHYGLVGMGERAASAGGSVEIDSAPGAGTTVRLSLPRTAVPSGSRIAAGRTEQVEGSR